MAENAMEQVVIRFIADNASYLKSIAESQQAIKAFVSSASPTIDRLEKTIKDMGASFDKVSQNVNRLSTAVEKISIQEAKLATQYEKTAAAIAKKEIAEINYLKTVEVARNRYLTTQEKTAQLEIRANALVEAEKIKSANKIQVSQLKLQEAQVKQATKEIETQNKVTIAQILAQAKKEAAIIASEAKIEAAQINANARVAASVNTANKARQEESNMMVKAISHYTSLGSQLGYLIRQYVSLYVVIGTIKQVVNEGISFLRFKEETTMAFTVMMRSADAAKSKIAELYEFAVRSPLTFKEVTEASRQLMAYGFAAHELVDTMKLLGTVGKAVGVSMNDMAYVYGTLRAQGRAYTRDLMQFAMRGIPIYEELASVMGVSVSNIQKLTSEGKVGFAEVEAAFNHMVNSGGKFSGMLDQYMNTLSGRLSMLTDLAQKSVGQLTKPLFDYFKNIVDQLIAGFESGGLDKIIHNLSIELLSLMKTLAGILKLAFEFKSVIFVFLELKVVYNILDSLIPKLITVYSTLHKIIPLVARFGVKNIAGALLNMMSPLTAITAGLTLLISLIPLVINLINKAKQEEKELMQQEALTPALLQKSLEIYNREYITLRDIYSVKSQTYGVETYVGNTLIIQSALVDKIAKKYDISRDRAVEILVANKSITVEMAEQIKKLQEYDTFEQQRLGRMVQASKPSYPKAIKPDIISWLADETKLDEADVSEAIFEKQADNSLSITKYIVKGANAAKLYVQGFAESLKNNKALSKIIGEQLEDSDIKQILDDQLSKLKTFYLDLQEKIAQLGSADAKKYGLYDASAILVERMKVLVSEIQTFDKLKKQADELNKALENYKKKIDEIQRTISLNNALGFDPTAYEKLRAEFNATVEDIKNGVGDFANWSKDQQNTYIGFLQEVLKFNIGKQEYENFKKYETEYNKFLAEKKDNTFATIDYEYEMAVTAAQKELEINSDKYRQVKAMIDEMYDYKKQKAISDLYDLIGNNPSYDRLIKLAYNIEYNAGTNYKDIIGDMLNYDNTIANSARMIVASSVAKLREAGKNEEADKFENFWYEQIVAATKLIDENLPKVLAGLKEQIKREKIGDFIKAQLAGSIDSDKARLDLFDEELKMRLEELQIIIDTDKEKSDAAREEYEWVKKTGELERKNLIEEINLTRAKKFLEGNTDEINAFWNRMEVRLATTLGMKAYASGTGGAAPGIALVGEKGPELVIMHGGETVIPNHKLHAYANGTPDVSSMPDFILDIFNSVKDYIFNSKQTGNVLGATFSGVLGGASMNVLTTLNKDDFFNSFDSSYFLNFYKPFAFQPPSLWNNSFVANNPLLNLVNLLARANPDYFLKGENPVQLKFYQVPDEGPVREPSIDMRDSESIFNAFIKIARMATSNKDNILNWMGEADRTAPDSNASQYFIGKNNSIRMDLVSGLPPKRPNQSTNSSTLAGTSLYKNMISYYMPMISSPRRALEAVAHEWGHMIQDYLWSTQLYDLYKVRNNLNLYPGITDDDKKDSLYANDLGEDLARHFAKEIIDLFINNKNNVSKNMIDDVVRNFIANYWKIDPKDVSLDLVPGYANGVIGANPGIAMVGEKGPELVMMKGGETVIPNNVLRRYAKGTLNDKNEFLSSPNASIVSSDNIKEIVESIDKRAKSLGKILPTLDNLGTVFKGLELDKTQAGKMLAGAATGAPLGASVGPMVLADLAKFVASIENVNKVLNPFSTILEGARKIIEPLMNDALQPLVDILMEVGQEFGQVLAPVINLVAIPLRIFAGILKITTIPLKMVGKAFEWLNDKVIVPVGNFIIDMINGLIKIINKLPFVDIAYLDHLQTVKEATEGEKLIAKGNKSLTDTLKYLNDKLQAEVDKQIGSYKDLYELGLITASEYEANVKRLNETIPKESDAVSQADMALSDMADIAARIKQLMDVQKQFEDGNLTNMEILNILKNNGLISYAVGTPNIPADMTAKVHAGEMIVPRTFADSIRSGELVLSGGGNSSSTVYNVNVNVAGSVQTENDLAVTIAKAIKKQTVRGYV